MRRKAIPIILPVNVRNIRLKSVLVLVMIITSNVTPLPGVRITGIIHKPVLCRPLLTTNVRTANLITRVVKKTGRGLVVNKVMSTLVLRDAFTQRQTVVRGIALTANAVPLLLLPDVRPIIRLPATRPAAHPVLILADIPVIAVVMIPARPELLKTIQARIQQQPNAAQDVTDVNLVRPVPARLTLVLMPERLNVTADKAVINVMIPVAQDKNRFLVLRRMSKQKYQQPNAEPLVMNVNITLIVP